MASVMEFLLNLLLTKGKVLREVAAKTLREAINRCLNYRSKLHMEYDKLTRVNFPADDMLEFVNYHAGEYSTEAENFIVTREFHCRLQDRLSKMKKEENLASQSSEQTKCQNQLVKMDSPAQICAAALTKNIAEEVANSPQTFNAKIMAQRESEFMQLENAKIIENLFAILKSQELLFANINKLVTTVEKQRLGDADNAKIEYIKDKLSACADILSGNRKISRFPDNIINDIIEEEITRCRFRHGDFLTSKEINLRRKQNEGLEVALEVLHRRSVTRRPSQHAETQTTIVEQQIQTKTYNERNTAPEQPIQKIEILEIPKSEPVPAKTPAETAPNKEAVKEAKTVVEAEDLKVAKKSSKTNIPMRKPTERVKYGRIRLLSHNRNEKLRKQQIDSECQDDSKKFTKTQSNTHLVATPQPPLSRSFSNTDIIVEKRIIKQKSIDSIKRLIEVNKQQFQKFEDSLWHSSTTMKYLSLKANYMNTCKCNFANRKQFQKLEYKISRQLAEEKQKLAELPQVSPLPQGKMINPSELQKIQERIVKNSLKSLSSSNLDDKPKLKIIFTLAHASKLAQELKEYKTAAQAKPSCSSTNKEMHEPNKIESTKHEIKSSVKKEAPPVLIMNIAPPSVSTKKKNEVPSKATPQDAKTIAKTLFPYLGIRDENSAPKEQQLKPVASEEVIPTHKVNKQVKELKEVKETKAESMKIETLNVNKDFKVSENAVLNKAPEKEATPKSQPIKYNEIVPKKQLSEEVTEYFIKPVEKSSNPAIIAKIEKIAVLKPSEEMPIIRGHFAKQVETFINVGSSSLNKTAPSTPSEKSPRSIVGRKFKLALKPTRSKTNLTEDNKNRKESALERVVSQMQIKKEADVLKLNKRAFDELESSLKSIRILSDRKPVDPQNKKLKTTTEIKKRRIDEPVKKSMSTKHLVVDMKPLSKTSSASDVKLKSPRQVSKIAKSAGDEVAAVAILQHKTFVKKPSCKLVGEVLAEIKKSNEHIYFQKVLSEPSEENDTNDKQSEKNRTFLKSASEISYKKQLNQKKSHKIIPEKKTFSLPKFRVSKKDMLKEEKVDKIEENKTQMRRTTKAAMRKQQVMTILPKIEKKIEVEKKKPKISVLETEEIKIIKALQNTESGKNRVVINVTKKQINYTPIKTIYNKPKTTYSSNVKSWKKAPYDKKINMVKWEEEDVKKFVNIFHD